MCHKVWVSQYWFILSCYRQPRWPLIHMIIWDRILIIRIFLKLRVICEKILQMDVLQCLENYRYLKPEHIEFINSISEDTYDYIFCLLLFRCTRRPSILSRNFMYVNFISHNHMSSSLVITFASKVIHCVNLEAGQ